jgi:cobalt-zinc-cadmium efflux system protein
VYSVAMAHSHHGHTHPHHGKALGRAAWLTLAYMWVELGVGWWSGSLALLSDGLHMFLDSGGLFLSLFVYWISRKPPSLKMSFGYARAQVLGAMLNGILILGGAAWVVFQAVQRFQDPQPIRAIPATFVALLGLGVNLISLRVLAPSKDSNLNIRAAYVHVLGDLLGSIGAVFSTLIVWFTGWLAADAWVTLGIGSLLAFNAIQILRSSTTLLMNSAPAHLDPGHVRAVLAALPGVTGVHDLHIWEVSHGRSALSAHLVAQHPSAVLKKAQEQLHATFGLRHTTLQIEDPAHFDPSRCFDCATSQDLLDDSDSCTHSSIG